MQVTLDSDQLVFSKNTWDLSEEFLEEDEEIGKIVRVPFGAICAFDADRFGQFAPFVVVGSTPTHYEVIFPRMRLEDGVVKFGQDQLVEREYSDALVAAKSNECPCYKGQGYSECGCVTELDRAFAESFVESSNRTYQSTQILQNPRHHIFYSVLERSPAALNTLDRPLSLKTLKQIAQ